SMKLSRSSSFESCLNAARSSSLMIQRTSSSSHFLYVLESSTFRALEFCFFCLSLIGRFSGSTSGAVLEAVAAFLSSSLSAVSALDWPEADDASGLAWSDLAGSDLESAGAASWAEARPPIPRTQTRKMTQERRRSRPTGTIEERTPCHYLLRWHHSMCLVSPKQG